MLKYVRDLPEKVGGKPMVVAKCRCGKEFPIRKLRLETQLSCSGCAPSGPGNKDLLRRPIGSVINEVKKLKKGKSLAYTKAIEDCLGILVGETK